jgi:VanZ family protein
MTLRRMILFVRYWLPLFVWLAVIFSASADAQSTEHTSRFLEPFLRWLNPHISAGALENARWLVRKTAHMTEFGLMAWLTWRALRRPVRNDPRPWAWKPAAATLAIVILYAAADEVHQRFVPNRTPSITDVCIDTAGAVLGLAATQLCYRRRKN